MKKATKYTDEPIGGLKIVADFLPPPRDLILKKDTINELESMIKEGLNSLVMGR